MLNVTPQGTMLDTIAALVFWTSAALVAYAYVGYPLLIYGLGRLRRQPIERRDISATVSLLVPAYNEGRMIKAKIDNCLQLDYPPDRLEIIVASDGSTDATGRVIAEAAKAGRIRGVVFPERRGKAAVLNDLVAMASGDILVLSDATTMVEPGSIRALVSNFADPRVGCVSGLYRLVASHGDSSAGPESLYWRYERFIRESESRLGVMLGAHGALYSMRRALFEPIPPGTRNEDFTLPVGILMRGYRSIYETRAVASEDSSEMTGFRRRVGLAAGNYQQLGPLMRMRGWLRNPFVLFELLSHKILRLLSPFLILAVYFASALLVDFPFYAMAFAAQTVFIVAALLGVRAPLRRRMGVLIAAPYYFCMVNAAGLIALQRIVRRNGHAAPKLEDRDRGVAARAA
jgi:cellulose synthase/poly-beta-1,6-N-acetylglucosamine synthase-like glycosyltransferase